ncbi:hypothetical protein F6X51_22085 [Methylobacterium planeticum]|uniref:Uncharacterized protein n=1 Tax=Methylobacterium planeticum TaxID=2615211 RepID=A0A6N6MLI9_9HYPH|nr:hypothetical protein F6X51_22085 [Methylobacterium planeticum]
MLISLAGAPTQGADATLAPARRPVALSGAERWSLRPTEAGPAAPGHPASAPAGAVPEARRHVRMVYPALIATR